MDQQSSNVTESQDFSRLKQNITSAHSNATNIHKQIWSADLSSAELQDLLMHAHEGTEAALKRYVLALESEAFKLRWALQNASAQLENCRKGTEEEIKGNACVLMEQKWVFERLLEAITGEKPEPARQEASSPQEGHNFWMMG